MDRIGPDSAQLLRHLSRSEACHAHQQGKELCLGEILRRNAEICSQTTLNPIIRTLVIGYFFLFYFGTLAHPRLLWFFVLATIASRCLYYFLSCTTGVAVQSWEGDRDRAIALHLKKLIWPAKRPMGQADLREMSVRGMEWFR